MKFYDKNGLPYSISHYENGLLHGEQSYFFDNGIKSHTTTFMHGKYHGPMRFYIESGHLKNEKIYVDGRQHGIETTYYDNGHLYGVIPYKDGKRIGIEKEFHSDGKSIKSLNELDDKSRTVRSQYFDFEGNKTIDHTANYSNNNLITETLIYREDILTSYKKEDKNRKWSLTENFDANGLLTGREELINKKRQGLYLSTVSPNDSVRTQRIKYTNGNHYITNSNAHYRKKGRYDKDKRIGYWRIVDRNGIHEINYNNQGNKDGKEQRTMPDGKLSFATHFKNGQYHGQHEKYDKTGKVLEKGEYRNNKRHGRWQVYDDNFYKPIFWQGEFRNGKK